MPYPLATCPLPELIARFRDKHILVIGDLMLDEFIWGRVSRISPEAPVPVVEVSAQSAYPGGAANVARNLREFTDRVSVMGLVGDDAHAEVLKRLLATQNIQLGGIQHVVGHPTIVKTRIIARQQHLVRVDREVTFQPDAACHARALSQLEAMLPELDAIILEDYAKGFLTQEFVEAISILARRAGKLLTVDPNPRNDLRWSGVTAVKPNRAEAFHAAGLPPSDTAFPAAEDAALLRAAGMLLSKWDTEMLLVTLGDQGMMLFRPDQPPCPIAPIPREVYDLSGAGDTAVALFTLALAADATPEEAAEIANHAGSVVVGKLGTAIVTPAELLASFAAGENG